MKDFDLAKKKYDSGLWAEDVLAKLVVKGRLTRDQYEEIVDEVYLDDDEVFSTDGS